MFGLTDLAPVLVADDVVRHRRDGRGAADGGDVAGLADRGGHDARQIAGLLLLPLEALVVRRQLGHVAAAVREGRVDRAGGVEARRLVDADELDRRVGLGGLVRVGGRREADRHDDVELLVDEGLDVLLRCPPRPGSARTSGPARPTLVAPSWAPSHEYWLKFLSLSVPTSVTRPILSAGPPLPPR